MDTRDDAETRLDPVHIELWCPHGPELDWQVVSLHGTEAISDTYGFTLELLCEDASADVDALLGADVELLLERGGLTRAIYGVIVELEVDVGPAGVPEHEGLLVRVDIAPAYRLLAQQLDTRFHAGQTVIEILAERLGEALGAFGRTLDVNSHISGSYDARDYCVQFRESTFDFCNRLMEEEGIAYVFVADPDTQREVMVLVDNNEAYAPAELLVPEPLTIVSHAPEELDRETISRLDWRRRRAPNRVVTRGHNYKLPTRYDEGEAEQPDHHNPSVRELYVDGERRQITDDPLGDPDAQSFTGGELEQRARQARVLLQQRQRDAVAGRGRANAIGFAAGTTIELAEALHGTGSHTELLLVRVVHEARRSDDADALDHVYANRFACMPRELPYRPALRTPKPRVFGVQTGVVVGRGGDEIHTDALGRVRVRFHADRHVGDDEHRSCWIRVAQAWAGPGYGSLVIPRVGMEVVVSFVDGNPDCPLITGCVYDGVNSPPRPLPAELSRSTFKTSSTPGGEGFNELMFEDAKGREQIFMHAQGRMDLRVRGGLFETVSGDREERIGPHVSEKSDTGSLNQFINADINLRAFGKHYAKIRGESYQHFTTLNEYVGAWNLQVNNLMNFNATELVVECAEHISQKSDTMEFAGSSVVTLKAGERLLLVSNNEIGLKVGSSFVHIGIDGIAISGPQVRINSGGQVLGTAGDGVNFEDFEMLDPIEALAADDGRPGGGGGGGGGGRRSHNSWKSDANRAPPMVKPKKSSPDVVPSHRGAINRSLVSVGWSADEVWCSEALDVLGEFDRAGDSWSGAVGIVDSNDGSVLYESQHDLGTGKAFSTPVAVCGILPRETGDGSKETSRTLTAVVDNVRSLRMLPLRFLHQAPRLHYEKGRARFDISVEDHQIEIGGIIRFKRGNLAYLIRLTDAVPEATGGASKKTIDGVTGWRHCKKAPGRGKHQLVYWDGDAWITVPDQWKNPLGTRLIGNALWREGNDVKMQMANDVAWPDPGEVGVWSSTTLARLNQRIAEIASDVNGYWSDTFDIKREDCLSNLIACCGYRLRCAVSLAEVDSKRDAHIILAENDTRANAGAWPFDVDARTAAHEFGHHLGNPDEYPGATSVDRSVNGDGAEAGIDERGLMGSGETARRRYLNTVCRALSRLVEQHCERLFTYVPMEKLSS